jgi:hypothetical protein
MEIADTTVFGDGIISLENRTEQSITFSRDGKIAVFSVLKGRKANRNFWVLMQSEFINGHWKQPVECPFSGIFSDYGPFFSPNDHSMYFTSRRPVNIQDTISKPDYDIWKVTFKNGIWGKPIRLANYINTNTEEYAVSASNNKLIICAGSNDTIHRSDFFVAMRKDECMERGTLIRLTYPPNSDMWEGQPYIDPDEKFILFNYTDTTRMSNEDIFVSYHINQKWTAPTRLNSRINSSQNEFMSCLSPDGKYIFFGRNGQLYVTRFSNAVEEEKRSR